MPELASFRWRRCIQRLQSCHEGASGRVGVARACDLVAANGATRGRRGRLAHSHLCPFVSARSFGFMRTHKNACVVFSSAFEQRHNGKIHASRGRQREGVPAAGAGRRRRAVLQPLEDAPQSAGRLRRRSRVGGFVRSFVRSCTSCCTRNPAMNP